MQSKTFVATTPLLIGGCVVRLIAVAEIEDEGDVAFLKGFMEDSFVEPDGKTAMPFREVEMLDA